MSPLWAFDLTVTPLPAHATDHVRLVHATDWASTPLGPMSAWTVELRMLVNRMLTDPWPAMITCGPDRTCIYNEQYIPIAGAKHPRGMGQPFFDFWPEIKDSAFGASFSTGETTGRASSSEEDALFFLQRNHFVEEMWCRWSNYPVLIRPGEIGFYNNVFDTTSEVLRGRRMSTLLYLGECMAAALDTRAFWDQIKKGLEPLRTDVSFAVLYSSEHMAQNRSDGDQDISSADGSMTSDGGGWLLEGTLGLPDGQVGLPERMDLAQSSELFSPAIRQALRTGVPALLSVKDGTFPLGLIGVAKSREYGDDCQEAVLCPVNPTNRDRIMGFALVGINTRRPYDAEYQQFTQLLSRQMATSAASIVLVADELRRSRMTADSAMRDRFQLSQKLAETAMQMEDSETRFQKMADMAPVGIFQADRSGTILYANGSWLDLTEQSAPTGISSRWDGAILEHDRALINNAWSENDSIEAEVRLERPFVTGEVVDGEHVRGTTWIIVSAYCKRNVQGGLEGISGCFTDISRQKWAEEFQQRRVKQAQEIKRQQENFMDMTSHEARNPLSAMMLCADSIAGSLQDVLRSPGDMLMVQRDMIESHLENAETIAMCAQHQKRIIDDVLTLSKLDSGLLLITPVDVQPFEVITRSLKVFDGELNKAGIRFTCNARDSQQAPDTTWLKLDPSRLTQILINLMTNAIKFTQLQNDRHIDVTMYVTSERPCQGTLGVQCLSQHGPGRSIPTVEATDAVYLCVTVQDTGIGLKEEELQLIFERFQQANPKTHVEYGGSGLGMFISRNLVQLQGGQIGIASEYGRGSTFAFYIQATRSAGPDPGASAVQSPSPAFGADYSGSSRKRAAPSTPLRHTPTASPNKPMSNLVSNNAEVKYLLIVEDNLVNQKVMTKQLRNAGYTVSVANHGVEALEILGKTRFCRPDGGTALDVILMDVEMPVMGGLECTRRIRAMQENGEVSSHVPIIGVTANARQEQQDFILAAGMDLVVTKPFRMHDLVSQLERIKHAGSGAHIRHLTL